MKRLLLVGSMLVLSGYANAANLFCDITPTSVRIGQIGDSDIFTYICSSDKCYNMGKFSNEKTKQFYAMGLAAVSAGNKMRVTYYASSAGACADIPKTEQAFSAIYSK